MLPVIFSIGSFHLFSFSVLLIIAWAVWSFYFWRYLRSLAILDEPVFDAMFYSTLVALFFARVFFVILNFSLFSENLLRVVALWVQPGLSLYGAIFGALLTYMVLSIKHKMRFAYLLDAFTLSFPIAYIIGSIGSFLDGSVVGKTANLPWAVHYIGAVGSRHPVQIYELFYCSLLLLGLLIFQRHLSKHYPTYHGRTFVLFLTFFSLGSFVLEFFKQSPVYFAYLSPEQWICVLLFGESLGIFFVKYKGTRHIMAIVKWIVALARRVYEKVGGYYDCTRQRIRDRYEKTS